MNEDSHYAPPKSALVDTNVDAMRHTGIYANKNYVVYNEGVAWPSRCFKCNAPTTQRKRLNISYVNPWIYLSILVSILITIILVLIFRKKFVLELPICSEHSKRRRHYIVFQWITVAVTAVAFLLGVAEGIDWLLILSLVMVLVVVISAIAGRMIYVAKYKDDELWVRGAGKAFLSSLPSDTR